MTNNNIPVCEVHGVPMRWKEGGVSKTTGKPYNGFWSCGQKDGNEYCKYKPKVQGANPTQKFTSDLNQDLANDFKKKQEMQKTDDITKMNAKNNSAVIVAALIASGKLMQPQIKGLLMDLSNFFYKLDPSVTKQIEEVQQIDDVNALLNFERKRGDEDNVDLSTIPF